jgi:hypothetical protein
VRQNVAFAGVTSSLAITEFSEVQQLRVELYQVHGHDYSRSNCDTVDGSNCKIVNGVNVRASGINSLYVIRHEVTCRVTYTQHVTIINNKLGEKAEDGWVHRIL